MKKNIPINKGNYYMETEARIKKFETFRGEGWEENYKRYRRDWEENANHQTVSEYPLLVDLEISTLCNLNCPMCYTTTEVFKKQVNATFMNKKLFQKIIDEIKGKVPAVRMSLRGEPTIHPDFLEMLRYAKDQGIPEVSFLTNGSKMIPEFFEKVLLAGADWITVSIDGVDEMYESIRKPLKFQDTFQKIKQMKEIKDKHHTHRPVIKIQSIWPAISENAEEFYNLFEPYTDSIAFNPLSDDKQNDTEIEFVEDFSCPQLYQRLVVAADGNVLLCSNDEENDFIIGNANTESIYALWHGQKLSDVRNRMKEKDGYKSMKVCRKCYLPRKMQLEKNITINGRDICVMSYTNRSQEIGK